MRTYMCTFACMMSKSATSPVQDYPWFLPTWQSWKRVVSRGDAIRSVAEAQQPEAAGPQHGALRQLATLQAPVANADV